MAPLERVSLERAWALCPLPMPRPTHLFHLPTPESLPFLKKVKIKITVSKAPEFSVPF